ncbi:MAG: AEC family transporter [Spirochaetales bacterium]|nr:AEC family transporter [Spirochaetales bacterium]
MILVIMGVILGRKFPLDLFTLSKLNFYLYLPVFIFYQVYTAEINSSYLQVCIYVLALMFIAFVICRLIEKIGRFPRGIGNAFLNSVLFYNTGNFGLPLITLIFLGTPWMNQAVTTHIMILLVQNTMMTTFGFFNADSGKMHWRESVGRVLKMPQIYATILALVLQLMPFRLEPLFFWPAVDYLRMGMIPLALVLLGIQLGRTKFRLGDHRIYLAVAVRLTLIPAVAYFLIKFFGFTGVTAQAALIASGCPTAVTTVLIALESDNEPDFASQMVLTTTLFSILSLVVLISLAEKLFPIL